MAPKGNCTISEDIAFKKMIIQKEMSEVYAASTVNSYIGNKLKKL